MYPQLFAHLNQLVEFSKEDFQRLIPLMQPTQFKKKQHIFMNGDTIDPKEQKRLSHTPM